MSNFHLQEIQTLQNSLREREEYITDLEREIDRLKMRILSLEVAGQNVVYQATEMWKHGAIREWLDLTKEAKP